MLYLCHECRGTLDKEDINLDGKIDLFDLGALFPDIPLVEELLTEPQSTRGENR